jgi:hypothetical protein
MESILLERNPCGNVCKELEREKVDPGIWGSWKLSLRGKEKSYIRPITTLVAGNQGNLPSLCREDDSVFRNS